MSARSSSPSARGTKSAGTSVKKPSKKQRNVSRNGKPVARRRPAKRKSDRASSSSSRPLTTMGLDLSLTGTGLVVLRGHKVLLQRRLVTASDPKGAGPRLTAGGAFQGDVEARIEWITGQIRKTWRHYLPDLVAIENHAFNQRGGGVHGMYELHGVVKNFLHRKEAPWILIPSTTLKKLFTDNGRASKQEMIAQAKIHFPKILPIDDIADAYALAKVSARGYDRLIVQVEDDEEEE